MKLNFVGNGNVMLVASPQRCYTDIAARFVRSEKDIEDIIASPYDKNIVRNIISGGHGATTEFDYYLFAIEGYSRVTEAQLIRKRLASYMIKSGRSDLGEKREYSVVVPETLMGVTTITKVSSDAVAFNGKTLTEHLGESIQGVEITITTENLLNILEEWYSSGIAMGVPDEDMRYLKPQATEFKALIGMNARALMDWFKVRCCKRAQSEIRELANKMLALCKKDNPDLFERAGANCVALGYCPENGYQHRDCEGKVPTHVDVLELIRNNRR